MATRRSARGAALRGVLVALLAFIAWRLIVLSDPSRTPPDDFISSWAAGRLAAAGENPWDAERVLVVQRAAGWGEDIPYRVWYPPWAITLLVPFGVLPYATARLAWYLVHLAATVLAADLLWRYYDGAPRWRGLSWVAAMTFWPTLLEVRTGQISAFVVLGLVGFLVLVRRDRAALAGTCLPLAAVKPQLVHLFWLALLLWVVREKRWRVGAGAAGTAAILTLLLVVSNPAIVMQFFRMAANEAPRAPASTLGTAIRLIVAFFTGREWFALQFVPPALSVVWLAAWLRKHGRVVWPADAPVLLIASMLTTAYAWVYDQVVLLVPLVQVAAAAAGRLRAHARLVLGYVALNAGIAALNLLDIPPFWYVWVPFAFAFWYAAARRYLALDVIRPGSPAPGPPRVANAGGR